MTTDPIAATLLRNLERLIAQGYVTRRVHPQDHDLFIWNYTPKCQFDRYWIPETLMARGLIIRGDGTIVARPFKKFFNLEEHETGSGALHGPFPMASAS